MSYLLDTCVLSEFVKPKPDARVVQWLQAQDERELYLSVIVLGELARGIAHLPESKKRRALDAWLHTDLRTRFHKRILDITPAIALEWGARSGGLQRAGQILTMADGLIGATAVVNSLVVVTRNTKDLLPTGASVFNPWTD